MNAEIREAKAALSSGYTLLRLEAPTHLDLIDAMEQATLRFIEAAGALSQALDVSEARFQVLRAASRHATRRDDSTLPGVVVPPSSTGHGEKPGRVLQLVKNVYDGEGVA